MGPATGRHVAQLAGLAGRGDLPDGQDAVQRAGQDSGAVRASDIGLFAAEAEDAGVGFGAKSQRSDRERALDYPVPAVCEQDGGYLRGGYRGATHIATFLSAG